MSQTQEDAKLIELVQRLIEKDKKNYKAFLQKNVHPRLDSLTILALLIPLAAYTIKHWNELGSITQAFCTDFGLIILIRALQTLLLIYEVESTAEENHASLEKLKELIQAKDAQEKAYYTQEM